MKELDDFQKIKSLEHRMDNPMTLLEAEAFNAEMVRKAMEDKGKAERMKNNYQFSEGEMYGYFPLTRRDTGLPVELLADDSGTYKKFNHPLWLLIYNGYKPTDEVIPMTIDATGEIVGTYDLNISYDDIRKVREFMHRNMDGLKAVADEQMSSYEFVKNMDLSQYRMAEGVERLDEMAKLTSDMTNLKSDIWIDNAFGSRSGLQHSARIKFKAEQGVDDPNDWPTMKLQKDNYEVLHMPQKTFLKNKDIKKIAKFVDLNFDLISALYCREIGWGEFIEKLQKLSN